MRPVETLALASIGVGLSVLALKMLAWWITGSVALLSDALESVVNVATAIAALVAIRVAARPADAGHPFGHHKAEYFSAVLEGVLIVLAALLILREAVGGLLSPGIVTAPATGIGVSLIATGVNWAWSRVLITQGQRARSPALVADGRHLFSDVMTSLGVAAGILLAWATGWWILDPLLATLVAVAILWSGWRVIAESLSGLMDTSVPDETLRAVREAIAESASGAMEAHDLRTRAAGQAVFIEFHLVMPDEMTVYRSHEICDRIETALRARIEGARITIHVEPEHKSKGAGVIPVDGA